MKRLHRNEKASSYRRLDWAGEKLVEEIKGKSASTLVTYHNPAARCHPIPDIRTSVRLRRHSDHQQAGLDSYVI